MDNDSNWIASTRAFQFCHSRGIDVDYYFNVYEYSLYLSQQYKLKCFYQLQNTYISHSLPLRYILSAYPFVFEGLPSVLTRDDFLSNHDVSFCISLGIDLAELYPDDRHLDTRFVESLNHSHSPVYASWREVEINEIKDIRVYDEDGEALAYVDRLDVVEIKDLIESGIRERI